ncbi:hypothetical protein HY572_03230 [Candidatus Micrarchaeota archaeon]|nr:hypothetical protein [Candidatus Micrarchaeota archaeon]
MRPLFLAVLLVFLILFFGFALNFRIVQKPVSDCTQDGGFGLVSALGDSWPLESGFIAKEIGYGLREPVFYSIAYDFFMHENRTIDASRVVDALALYRGNSIPPERIRFACGGPECSANYVLNESGFSPRCLLENYFVVCGANVSAGGMACVGLSSDRDEAKNACLDACGLAGRV